jgi:hypothetical protein
MGLSGLSGLSGLRGVVPEGGPEWFEAQITTTDPGQTYSWQSSAGISPNHTTEWGDGTTTTHTANGIYSRTYANAGVYTLRIKCAWASDGAFNMRPNADRTRLTALLGPIPGFPGLDSLLNCFSGCSSLAALPQDLLRYVANVTNLQNCFNGCSSLTALPQDLLRYVTNVTNLQGCFGSCTSLAALPQDLLRYVTNVTSLQSCFNGCTSAPLRADLFGPDPTNMFLDRSANFTNAFRNVGTAPGTAQGTAPTPWLYNYGTGTPTTTGAFSLNTAENISNYDDIPLAWR